MREVDRSWPQPPEPPPVGNVPVGADGAAIVIGYAVSLAPLLIAVLLTIVTPGFVAPMYDDRIGIAGVPAGLLVYALVGGLSLIGVLVVRAFRSWRAVAAVIVMCATPGVFLIVLGPALVLIAINLRS